nr:isopeptide-forming domain-containing fimbrial protein [Oscillospiraceae bacterium]
MKHTRRIASLLLALVMVFAMAISVSAEGTGTITVTNAAEGETYAVIKLFDASISTTTTEVDGKTETTTNIVYTGDIPTSLADYFEKNSSGNVVQKAGVDDADLIAAVQAWAATQTPAEGNSKVATSNGTVAFDNLPYGYYAVTTTQGTVVSINSTTPTASVTDKNTAPTLDKEITGATYVDAAGEAAMAEVGSTVTYTSTITVGAGAKNYVYHDTMEDTLTFNAGSVKVYKGSVADGNIVDSSNYEVKNGATHGEDPATVTHTFDVDFTPEYEKTLVKDDKLIIVYTATVNGTALTTDPANNTAYVSYGNAGETTEDSTSVYNASIQVTKVDGDQKPLADAGFVLTRTVTENDTTKTQYYKLDNGIVSWVDNIDGATELVTTEDSNIVTFTSLSAGTYTLVENTVPDGYNKAADVNVTIALVDNNDNNEDTFTVTYTGTEANTNNVTVMNQAGSTLPSTGGMGTTLFYIVGGLMVAAAVVLLVTKKRMASAE